MNADLGPEGERRMGDATTVQSEDVLRVANQVQLYVDQGGNRPGAFAIYLEPWHADVFTFLKMGRKKGVVEATAAAALKYALWVPDAFMRAVDADGEWWLMSPDECPGLDAVWG